MPQESLQHHAGPQAELSLNLLEAEAHPGDMGCGKHRERGHPEKLVKVGAIQTQKLLK